MKHAALLALLSCLPLASCANECHDRCLKERQCMGLTDSVGLDNCTKDCQLLVQEQGSADRLSKCVSCYDGKACEDLFPADPQAPGACDQVCR